MRYEVYENENLYLIYQFVPFWFAVLSLMAIPVVFLRYGILGMQEATTDVIKMLFPKSRGSFLSETVYKDPLNRNEDEKFNEYVIVFAGHEGLDEIRISVKEDINRPNNPDDIDIISEYISNNYGSRDYEVIAIDMIEKVKL